MSVLVTGGSGGLGTAIGEAFARRGYAIALLDLEAEPTSRVADRLSDAYGVTVAGVACDVTDRESVERAWADAERAVGTIDVVVNNAGIFTKKDFLDLTLEQWQRTLDVNLTGPFHVSQCAARSWVPAGVAGSIVNVASIAAFTAGHGGAVDYGASKAGLVGLTIHLAVDLGPHGIRANGVAPGSFRSPMSVTRLAAPEEREKSEALIPLGRVGEAEEVAATVLFLAVDGTYVNGAVIACDGGTVVKM